MTPPWPSGTALGASQPAKQIHQQRLPTTTWTTGCSSFHFPWPISRSLSTPHATSLPTPLLDYCCLPVPTHRTLGQKFRRLCPSASSSSFEQINLLYLRIHPVGRFPSPVPSAPNYCRSGSQFVAQEIFALPFRSRLTPNQQNSINENISEHLTQTSNRSLLNSSN